MTPDAHGNPTAGPPDAVARYDHALDRLLRLRTDVVPAASTLVRDAPDVPMAQALWAYLMLSSTDAADVPAARESVDALGAARRALGAARRAATTAPSRRGPRATGAGPPPCSTNS